MTAAQKAARVKFNKAIAIRKKTGCSLKEAFDIAYGRKSTPISKVVNKVKTLVKKAQDAYYEGYNEAARKSDPTMVKKRKVGASDKKSVGKTNTKCGIVKKHTRGNSKVKSHLRKVSGVKKPDSVHKDTKSHNVNIRVISGISKNDELKRLTQLAAGSTNKLVKKVASILKSKVTKGGYDSLRSLINDVLRNGLQSGIINDLIYYTDTKAWFKKYKPEIMKLLREVMFNYGSNNPSDIFGKNWDSEDPFAQDTINQNLLAWFSFEEISRELADSLGYDL
jgi:hypothetical protein